MIIAGAFDVELLQEMPLQHRGQFNDSRGRRGIT
jgi:hypothetical protein